MAEHWYWSVDVPGLTREGAARVSDLCESEGLAEFGCIPDDPRHVLVLRLDVASVKALAGALEGVLAGAPVGADGSSVGPIEAALLETCRDWMEWRVRDDR